MSDDIYTAFYMQNGVHIAEEFADLYGACCRVYYGMEAAHLNFEYHIEVNGEWVSEVVIDEILSLIASRVAEVPVNKIPAKLPLFKFYIKTPGLKDAFLDTVVIEDEFDKEDLTSLTDEYTNRYGDRLVIKESKTT